MWTLFQSYTALVLSWRREGHTHYIIVAHTITERGERLLTHSETEEATHTARVVLDQGELLTSLSGKLLMIIITSLRELHHF